MKIKNWAIAFSAAIILAGLSIPGVADDVEPATTDATQPAVDEPVDTPPADSDKEPAAGNGDTGTDDAGKDDAAGTSIAGEPKSDEPADPKAGEPKTDDSSEPKTDEPAEPKTDEPADPKADDPAEPKTDEPADPKADDPAEPRTDEPADPKADDPEIEDPEAYKAIAAYEAQLEEWRNLIRELRDLRDQFTVAEEGKSAALRTQWEEKIVAGREMLPRLQKAAVGAYLAEPNADRQVSRFLLKVLQDAWNRDDFSELNTIASALIENESGHGEAYGFAFNGAFCTNDFAAAEKLLEKAVEFDALTDEGKEYAAVMQSASEEDSIQKRWAREVEIRKQEAEKDDLPRVRMKTSQGDLVIELYEDHAPETVANFVSLVEDGFYDGLSFHRVLEHFMAQGGDPKGDGTGGPGYNIYCECHNEEIRHHFRATLSMAHAGRDTGGSQFFLTFRPTPHLDGRHTVFGRVIEGLDVLTKLQRIDPSATPPRPEADTIEKAEVIRKRDHEYKPNKVQQ